MFEWLGFEAGWNRVHGLWALVEWGRGCSDDLSHKADASSWLQAVLTWKSLSVEATVLSQEVTCPLP